MERPPWAAFSFWAGGSGSDPVDGPFELVIFDCDGVLVDSEHLAVRAERAARIGVERNA